MFSTKKTRMMELCWQKVWWYIKPFRYNTGPWRTDEKDGRTEFLRDKNCCCCVPCCIELLQSFICHECDAMMWNITRNPNTFGETCELQIHSPGGSTSTGKYPIVWWPVIPMPTCRSPIWWGNVALVEVNRCTCSSSIRPAVSPR